MNDLKLKLGHPVWLFDENHRVYTERKKGGLSGRLIWREHWRKYEIVGETTQSWLIGYNSFVRVKIPKKKPREKDWLVAFSQAEIDERVWLHDNAYFLGEFVGRLTDHALLREVAAKVGYKDREQS